MKHIRAKAIPAACLLALLCVLLAGCGASGAFDGSRVSDESGFRMEYAALNREETAALQLAAGEEIQVILSHSAGSVDDVEILCKTHPFRFIANDHRPVVMKNRQRVSIIHTFDFTSNFSPFTSHYS